MHTYSLTRGYKVERKLEPVNSEFGSKCIRAFGGRRGWFLGPHSYQIFIFCVVFLVNNCLKSIFATNVHRALITEICFSSYPPYRTLICLQSSLWCKTSICSCLNMPYIQLGVKNGKGFSRGWRCRRWWGWRRELLIRKDKRENKALKLISIKRH